MKRKRKSRTKRTVSQLPGMKSLPDAIGNLAVPRKQGVNGHPHDSKVSRNAADYDGGNTVTDD